MATVNWYLEGNGDQMETMPLSAQPKPEYRFDYLNAEHTKALVTLYFPSLQMAQAYHKWFGSGAAHEAFGTWADEKGLT